MLLKKYKREVFIVILIVLTAVFLRLFRLQELFHFTYDESVFAFIGKRVFTQKHIPLIGGVTPFHVHLGPYFYWLSAILLYFSRFNPLGWGVFAALLSGLNVCLLYLFVRRNFSRTAAFYSVIIYCFSFYANSFDRHYWGILFNPTLTLVSLISLTEIYKKKHFYFIPLSLSLAFGFHTDPSTSILIILAIFSFFIFKVNLHNSYALWGLMLFLLSFLPLFIFDIRHNFVNINGLWQYQADIKKEYSRSASNILTSQMLIPNYFARIVYSGKNIDLNEEYAYCTKYSQNKLAGIPLPISLISVVILLIPLLVLKNMKDPASFALQLMYALILSVYLGTVLYAGFLGRPFFDHYLSTLLPVGIIFMAVILARTKKLLSLPLLIIFIYINLMMLSKTTHSLGYEAKKTAVIWATKNVSTDFSLESLSSCFRYSGYRYLFSQYGKEPAKSYVDQNFFWLYDSPPKEFHPPTTVVMVARDYQDDPNLVSLYQKYSQYVKLKKDFGFLEVLIVDNSKEILYEF